MFSGRNPTPLAYFSYFSVATERPVSGVRQLLCRWQRRSFRNRKSPKRILLSQLPNLPIRDSRLLQLRHKALRQCRKPALFPAVLLPRIVPTRILRNENPMVQLLGNERLNDL